MYNVDILKVGDIVSILKIMEIAQRMLPGAESQRFTICHGKIAWSHIKFFRSVEQ
jgi:hypothetical protein